MKRIYETAKRMENLLPDWAVTVGSKAWLFYNGAVLLLATLTGLVPSHLFRLFMYRHVFHVKIGKGSVSRYAISLATGYARLRIEQRTSQLYFSFIHPFVLLLMGLDILASNNRGNGVLIQAKKPVPHSYPVTGGELL